MSHVLDSFYVCLNLLDDPGFPLCLLSRASSFIDLLRQSFNVPLGVQ